MVILLHRYHEDDGSVTLQKFEQQELKRSIIKKHLQNFK